MDVRACSVSYPAQSTRKIWLCAAGWVKSLSGPQGTATLPWVSAQSGLPVAALPHLNCSDSIHLSSVYPSAAPVFMLVSNGGCVFKALLLTHTNTSPVPDEVMRLIHCKWIGFEEAGLALRCLSTLDLELLVGVTQTAASTQAHTHTH